MWFAVLLMSLWMALVLLGHTYFGLTHLLGVGAVAMEVIRRPAPRRA